MGTYRHLNLRQIEVFRVVIETSSMTEAGKILGVSQPAVSRQIRDLEARFGLTLFTRQAGRIVATRDAIALHREVDRCLDGLDQMATFANDLSKFRRQRLRIAATVGHSYFLLPKVIAKFHQEFEDVTISLRSGSSSEVVDLIKSSQSDIGFAILPHDQHDVYIQKMPEVELVCILPKNHPLLKKKCIRPRDLTDVPLLLISENSLMRKRLLKTFEDAGIKPDVILDSTYTGPICSLVGQNMGVSIVDHLTALSYVDKDIVIRPFKPAIPCELKLVTHFNRPLSVPAQAFVDIAKDVLVEIC